MILGYVPTTLSKRRHTLRRKRNEYHHYITKYYFEFDFCLTERLLASGNNEAKREQAPKIEIPKRKSFKESLLTRVSLSSSSKNPLTKKPLDKDTANTRLLPLFSQPSKDMSTVTSATREDTLLLQIRKDISHMVDIPTTSSSTKPKGSTNPKNDKKQSETEMNTLDFNGTTKTTKNRLFSNKVVKESLERIIYLWSIRMDAIDPSPYTSRYVPSIIDIVYPLYLTNLHGYIWDTHISTTMESRKTEQKDASDRLKSSPSLRFSDDGSNPVDESLDDFQLSSSEPTIFEDDDRKSRIESCERLSVGIGIETIPEEIIEEVEADTYWCLENFMTATNDYRTNHAFATQKPTKSLNIKAQKQTITGLQSMVVLIEKIVQRVDPTLCNHLKLYGVEYIWFAYRWVSSIHVRDMNERCILRLWDTCMCEDVDKQSGAYFSEFGFNPKRARKRIHIPGFLNFQVYICVALLHRLRDRILAQSSFKDILCELRNPGLETWEPSDVDILLGQAYVWSSSFQGSEEQVLDTATENQNDDTFKTWTQRCHWPPRRQKKTMTVFDKITAKRGKTGSK